MNLAASQTLLNRPSPAALLTSVDAIVPRIRERAPAAEKAMAVPRETVDELRETGIFNLMKPGRYGGYEHDFEPMVDYSYAVGQACASTAWCTGLYIVHNWILGMFPDECQHDVWDRDPGAVISGSYPPAGTCRAVDGGWRLSGKFGFSSGCDHAGWVLCGAIIPSHKEGEPPSPGFLLVPQGDCRIDHESWHVMGLKATGTKTVLIDDAFVPKHRVLRFSEAGSGAPPGTAVNTNPLYRIAFLALVPYSLATPALGAAQGALDDFMAQIGGRSTRGAVRGGSHKMKEFAQIQMRLADAAAVIDAARLVQKRDCRETLAEVTANNIVSTESRMRNRRGHSMIARSAVQVVDSLFYALGGHGLYLDNPVQRAWRDAHAVAQHVSLNWDAVGSMVGQHMIGLPPQGQW